MALGFSAEKYELLGKQGAYVLNRFVFYFGLPLLIFTSLSQQVLSSMFNFRFILAFALGMAISFCLIILVKKIAFKNDSQAEITIKSLLASLPNTGFMGIPILSVVVGTTGIIAAVIATILTLVLLLITGPWVNQEKVGHKVNLSCVALQLIKQPIIIAMITAFVFSGLHLHLPHMISPALKMIASTATPCALFAIGATLAEDKISLKVKDTCIISLLKLAVQPLLTMVLLLIFQVPTQWAIAGVILASLPIATVVFIYAAQSQIYVRESSSVIAITTIASIVTLPVFILISHQLWH
ncbi:AEC family transporter [Piscirickettsia litoralis]|uniref:Transporter n=1 Tax=Piscirickettsia litoralis TaxID=1891921 RepID=A0ABX2ZZS5_9GAMM|nr:AEC family transporter [Piscirickettsia litoralis]ODN42101.1 hypothetical protein BGC07_02980 [Piscirickettsia litoralis]